MGITTSAVIMRAPGAISVDGNSYKVEATTNLAELQENIGAVRAR